MNHRLILSLSLPFLLAGCDSMVGPHVNHSVVENNCATATSQTDQYECRLLQLVNEQRAAGANCGGQLRTAVGPLQMNPILHQVARNHAEDMAQRNYFDHKNLEGKSPFDRMHAAGYNYSTAGENIAAGSPTPEGTMQQWMQSPGHCENIMNGSFVDFGAGYASSSTSTYHYYWVQTFGAP